MAGISGNDSVTLNSNYASGLFDSKDVGIGKLVTVSGLTLSGADAGNYVLLPTTTAASITARALAVTGIAASDKTYDGRKEKGDAQRKTFLL